MKTKLLTLALAITALDAFALRASRFDHPIKKNRNPSSNEVINSTFRHETGDQNLRKKPALNGHKRKSNKFFGDEIHKPKINSEDRKFETRTRIMQSVEPVLEN